MSGVKAAKEVNARDRLLARFFRGDRRWLISPKRVATLVAWATKESLGLAEKSWRYYVVHRRLNKLNSKWKLKHSAQLFDEPLAYLVRSYTTGRVLQRTQKHTFLVITRKNGNEPFTVGELVIVDQSGLEVCGSQRTPRRHQNLWWEEFSDIGKAIHRATEITMIGG